MLFKNVLGGKKIKKQLISSVKNNRISHAQLFIGPEGNNKLALALAYAQYINCKQKTADDSCGLCSSCIKYKSLSHPDLYLVFPIIKSSSNKQPISEQFSSKWKELVTENIYVSLADWISFFDAENKSGQQGAIYIHEAESLQRKLALKNYEAKYRVVLIWMPEKMNVATANKLLKQLEEPPKGTIFLLVTENEEQLLPTILSRLQTIKTTKIDEQIGISFLEEKYQIPNEKAIQLLTLTAGSIGKTIKIISEEDESLDYLEQFTEWMRMTYKMDIQAIAHWTETIAQRGRNHQKTVLTYAIRTVRECLLYNFANKKLLRINNNEEVFIKKFASFIHEENSIEIIEKLEESIRNIDRNANAKIIFFELSLQFVKLLKV